jgi:tRNA-dihydrouridine synthase B
MAVSEMLLANPDVWDTQKTRMRMDHSAEAGLRSVQIAGADPEMMAFAARYNVEQGAQIVDINMGCPAKKVNKKLAGSAQDGIRITAMARRSPESPKIAVSRPLPCMVALAPASTRAKPSTTLSGRLSRPYRFLLSPMAT